MNKIYIAFLIAVSVTFIATPFVKELAKKMGAIDIPKDERRVHKVPIPRMGGLAIFIGFVVALIATVPMDMKIIGLITGASIIVVMGIFDDINPLSAKKKFLIQMLAAAVVISSGIKIDKVTNPLYFVTNHMPYIYLGIFSYPLTLVWIVGITNSINLIDGLDGLAAGVSVISSVTLFVVSLGNITSDPITMVIPIIAAILAGSAIGFLPYNFNPAKIFMGDTGSLFLGFMLAVISIMGVLKSAAALSIMVPIFAIGLPIFDTAFAMLRRYLSGKSMMAPDKGHLHHKLLDAGLSQKQAVLTLYLISAILGFSAVALVEVTFKAAIALVIAVMVFVLSGVKYLGLMETDQGDNKIDI